MRVLGIYGAGGLGREVLELAEIINMEEKRWDEFIFIDDGDIPDIINNCKVYKYIKAKECFSSALEVVIGIGEPVTREKLFEKLNNDGIVTPTLIHPDVYIPKSTKIGPGVIIQYGCFISCNVIIDNYTYINPQCNIGHDDIIEEGCMIAGFSNIAGVVHIGKWTYLGLSAAIKQTINIGNHVIVSMGAIVQRDVPDNMIIMGNPARIIARNEDGRVFSR